MTPRIDYIPSDEWERYCAPHAHLAVFGETLPPGLERIDYALVAVSEALAKPLAYLTVREFDEETAYLKRGGAFEALPVGARLKVYLQLLDYLMQRYVRLTTLVENTNVPYLKLAMTAGFRAIGLRNFHGSILLELLKERDA